MGEGGCLADSDILFKVSDLAFSGPRLVPIWAGSTFNIFQYRRGLPLDHQELCFIYQPPLQTAVMGHGMHMFLSSRGGVRLIKDVREGRGVKGKADECSQGEGGGQKSLKFCGRPL